MREKRKINPFKKELLKAQLMLTIVNLFRQFTIERALFMNRKGVFMFPTLHDKNGYREMSQ